MLARCHSACARGVDGEPTEVEVHIRASEPRFDVVGLPDAAGREARDRVRSAILSSGYRFPTGKIVVNLAPAGSRKVGAAHDLPIAVGVLAADGLLGPGPLGSTLLFGELALDGRLRPVRGAFLLAATAARQGMRAVLAPAANAAEAALAASCPVYGVENLTDAILFLSGRLDLRRARPGRRATTDGPERDFAEVKGQPSVKRAAVVAAAGGHNLLLVGPPGAGKTLIAERFPDLLTPLDREEALAVARIRSAAGLPVNGLPRRRPLRAPSCNASAAGLLGGGNPPRPGEISLAHHGVLFLDELPHFRGDALEGLRQPLESGVVTVSRAGNHCTFPAHFRILAAMNPCPCGYGGGPKCPCTPVARERYRRRISGPLLDRFDLRVFVKAVKFEDLRTKAVDADTSTLRADVERARGVQRSRFSGPRLNGSLTPRELDDWCVPDAEATAELQLGCDQGRLTARGVGRVLRVARTIADLDPAAAVRGVRLGDVGEAMAFRVELEGRG